MSGIARGVLFVGGEGPPAGRIDEVLASADLVVAADSGYELARANGCRPDLLVGDMDSIANLGDARSLLGEASILSFDREKDETDTEIGLRTLYERGIGSVTIVGGGGGRLDHLVGILRLFEREIRPKRWITARDEVVSLDERECFGGMLGVECSFFPVGEGEARMSSTGLRWPLDGLVWRHGDVGISNVGIEDRVTVEMLSGRLIMVRGLKEGADV